MLGERSRGSHLRGKFDQVTCFADPTVVSNVEECTAEDGFTQVGTKFVKEVSSPMSYGDAKANCEAMGSHLATLKDPEDAVFVTTFKGE